MVMYRPPPYLSSSRPDPRVSCFPPPLSTAVITLSSFAVSCVLPCDNNSVNKKTRTQGKSEENTRAKIAWPKKKTHHRVQDPPFPNPGHSECHDPKLSVLDNLTCTHAYTPSLRSSSNFVHLLRFPVLFGLSEINTTS